MLSLAKIALGVSTVLRETRCFLTPMSIKAAFSWLSAKIAQLQIKNSEKKLPYVHLPYYSDNETEKKNAAHTCQLWF